MQKNYMNFVKGVGLGMVAGMAAYSAAKSMTNNKTLAKKASKAVHSISNVVDDIQAVFK